VAAVDYMVVAVTRVAKLWVVLTANVALVGVLVVIGLTAHSLGVWAEGVDYLADAAAIGVTLLAIRLTTPTARRPQGMPRATRYAALVNAGWLFVLTLLVSAGAVDRLVSGVHEVHGLPVLVVSTVAAVVMLGGALLLGGEVDDDGGQEDLPVRAVLLDTAADAAAAAGVAAAGAVIYATGGVYWLDPTVALIVAVVVGYHAATLLGRVGTSLRT